MFDSFTQTIHVLGATPNDREDAGFERDKLSTGFQHAMGNIGWRLYMEDYVEVFFDSTMASRVAAGIDEDTFEKIDVGVDVDDGWRIGLRIPVQTLQSSSARMRRDLMNAIEAERNPFIYYESREKAMR